MGTVVLSKNTVPANAAQGRLIGTFTAPVSGVKYSLQSNPFGYFTLTTSGSLYVAWHGLAIAGSYSIQVRAKGPHFTESDMFSIVVSSAPLIPPLPPPVPTSIILTPSILFLPDNSASNTSLCTVAVTTSNSSVFSGVVTTDSPSLVAVSGLSLKLGRGLSNSDVGLHNIVVTATQSGHSVNTTFGLTITSVAGVVPFITSVVTPGTPRFDFVANQGGLGFLATTGSIPITVTALGRYALTSNALTHTVTLYDAGITALASVSVNMAGSTPGQFVYTSLSTPLVIWENTVFSLVSYEQGGSEEWLGSDTLVATTSDATVSTGTWIRGDNSVQNFDSGNHSFVPVNFKYSLGVPGGVSLRGSLFNLTYNDISFDTNVGSGGSAPVVTGTVVFAGQWSQGGIPAAGESFTFQWYLDGVAISPVLTDTVGNLAWSCNTISLGVPDGTHIIYVKFLEATAHNIVSLVSTAQAIIVANSGFNNGSQLIPVAATLSNQRPSPVPDFVQYNNIPMPTRNTYPFPTSFVPGSNSASLRVMDGTNYWEEIPAGPRSVQYGRNPLWCAAVNGTGAAGGGGGVFAGWMDIESDFSTPGAYLDVLRQNSMDGTRLNTWVSPLSTLKEDPAGGNVWWGCEVNGRVFRQDANGTVTTIVGRKRDRSRVSYLWRGPPGADPTENEMLSKITDVGNFPVEFDSLGGANDLCFDPRDSNILYVVCQVDNFIARINIATQTLTLYAGTPGAPDGYTGDGGPATSCTFAEPSSIIMADGTHADPAGTMYVCDSVNQAIRKITPGGTITTFCGGTVGPTPPTTSPMSGQMAGTTNYAVTSIVWDLGTNTGLVTMATTTTIKLGYTLALTGATNTGTGASGNPNTDFTNSPRYVVVAWTNSQSFTVGFEPSPPPKPTIVTIGGSPVFTKYAADDYSSPTSVSFAAGTLAQPNAIRFTSGGDIIFSEGYTKACRRIHVVSSPINTISRIGVSGNAFANPAVGEWTWLAVNTAGTIGPVDDILYSAINLDASHSTWRFSLDGTYAARGMVDTQYFPTQGPMDTVVGGPGHYPWATEISTHEGRLVGTGVANVNMAMIRLRQAGDYSVDVNTNLNIDLTALTNAYAIHVIGTPGGFPRGIRPAFESLRGVSGAGWITNLPGYDTLEDLNATFPTDAGLAAYIQAGMGGSVPRPELVGKPLQDYIYWVRRGTMAGSAPPTPVQTQPPPADHIYPIVLTISGVRDSATQITVSWTTDKSTIGCAVASTPTQYAMGTPNALYGLYSRMNTAFGTSHSETVQVPAGVSPMHYSVVVMDLAGNFAHTTDQVIGTQTIHAPTGSLVNGYGTWTYRNLFSPKPGWGPTAFYRVSLNGKWVTGLPGLGAGALMELTRTDDGNLYGEGGDQQWWAFEDYSWVFISSPNLVPTSLDPLPNYAGPYTPSTDGTSISGGSGSVTTDDGVWTFGLVLGAGWQLKLNGIVVNAPYGGVPVDQMQVNAHGQLFFHRTDQGWQTFEQFAQQPSAGPVSGPIPISVDFNPSSALPSGTSTIGTFVTAISVATSDGSPFAGTLTVDNGGNPPGDLKLDPSPTQGPNLVIARSPINGGGQNFTVTATQNGCTCYSFFNINAT